MALSSALLFTFSVLFLPNLANSASDEAPWGYYDGPKEEGPSFWKDSFVSCGTKMQSPIDLQSYEAKVDSSLLNPGLSFDGYDTLINLTVTNTGKSVVWAISDDLVMYGARLGTDHHAAQLHMHWGSKDYSGSEHTLDGERKGMELHIVHANSNYTTAEERFGNDDGFAVLGIFIEASDDDEDNEAYAPIIDSLQQVKYKDGEPFLVTGIKLVDLLPKDRDVFYRYMGGLTTPGCHESVTWTVLKDPVYISRSQMDNVIKSVYPLEMEKVNELNNTGSEVGYLQRNYRPIQDINGREVLLSKAYETDIKDRFSGASFVSLPGSLLCTVVLSVILQTLYHF